MANQDPPWADGPPRFPPGFHEKTPYDHLLQAPPPKLRPPPLPERTPAPRIEPTLPPVPLPSPDPEARAALAAAQEREKRQLSELEALKAEAVANKKSKGRTNAVAGAGLAAALAAGAPQLLGVIESFGDKAEAERKVAEARLLTEEERNKKIKHIVEMLESQGTFIDQIKDIKGLQQAICRPLEPNRRGR